MSEYRGDFSISTDTARFDIPAIHAYLTRSYWSPGIPIGIVGKAIANSLCFGLFHEKDHEKAQIGLARVVTDRATYAYLCDVYVLEEYRGEGLALWLMECVCAHPDLQGLRRFSLATRDAHELYRKFGFADLDDPSKHMEIFRLGVYGL